MKGFGPIEAERILAEDELFLIARDKYPISPGHTLVIVKRLVARFDQLTQEEKLRLLHWVDWGMQHLQTILERKPDGFNLGLNDGPAAGQTVPQLHFHIIPRYAGDVPDPRGGVRHVIPSKARYWCDEPSIDPSLVTVISSPTQLKRHHRWTGNDRIERNYHSSVRLSDDPCDLVLHWKTGPEATPHLIGCFRLHLAQLLRANYIRPDAPGHVRVRLYHEHNDDIFLEVQSGSPRLWVGKFPKS